MPDDLTISARLVIPAAELDEQFVRSGGPGGQHVNKTSTQVQLRWNVRTSETLRESDRELLLDRLGSRLTEAGELIVAAQESRSQSANREAARLRLTALVRGGLERQKKRRPTRRTAGSNRRRLEGKKRRSETKRLRRRPDE